MPSYSQESEVAQKLNGITFNQLKDGNSFKYDFLQKTKGKITIIEFWEAWCGPCIDGMHHLSELKEKYGNSLEIICVSKGDKEKTINFISKNRFDFTFIYDSTKAISNTFPHSSIPYSILINTKGEIKAKTSPAYISESIIEDLLHNKSVNLPSNYIPDNSEKPDTQASLISFKIERHQLGEPNLSKRDVEKKTFQIIEGYSAGEFIDTTEYIYTYELNGKNILQLYQYTFNNYPISRFIYNDSISYVNSKMLKHQYNLKFSSSNFLGNSRALLRRHLNATFDLDWKLRNINTPVLKISDIDTTLNSIQYSPAETLSSSSSCEDKGNIEFIVEASNISLLTLARMIENKMKIPIIFDAKLRHNLDVNMAIHEYDQDIEVWLKHFEQNGISFVKDTIDIEFIEIERAAHSNK